MQDWYERAAEVKATNPEMTAAQIGALLGKSASSVRSALKRFRESDQAVAQAVATDATENVATERNAATERNVTPSRPGRPPRKIDVETIDMAPLIRAARDTAIEAMTNPAVPWNVRAGTAVQIINGPHGKALAEHAAEAAPKDDADTLPEHVEELVVSLRRRVSDE